MASQEGRIISEQQVVKMREADHRINALISEYVKAKAMNGTQVSPLRPAVIIFCTVLICATVVLVGYYRTPVAEARIEARVEKHEQRTDARVKIIEDRLQIKYSEIKEEETKE